MCSIVYRKKRLLFSKYGQQVRNGILLLQLFGTSMTAVLIIIFGVTFALKPSKKENEERWKREIESSFGKKN